MSEGLTSTQQSVISPDSTAEAEALGGYQTLSVPAILGLLLGLAAPLSFVSPLLVFVPLFGIAVSLIALAKISAGAGQISGRMAALAGLCLSVGCLGASQGYRWSVERRVTEQTQVVAQQWFDELAANQPERAFGLTSAALQASQGEPEADPSAPGPQGPTTPPLEAFLERPLVVELLGLGERANARFVATDSYERVAAHLSYVRQHFEIRPSDADGEALPFLVAVTLEQRGLPRDSQAPAWRIANFERVAASD